MTPILVDAGTRVLRFGRIETACAIGRGGPCDAAEKREGDGRTPRGRWPVRGVLLRPDRDLIPPTSLPWRWLRPADGWSDDPADACYNRPVRHPHGWSAERLWRGDSLYDAIVVLGQNDAPPVPGHGSAIFLHLREGDTTEGCVAVARSAMIDLLALSPRDAYVEIV